MHLRIDIFLRRIGGSALAGHAVAVFVPQTTVWTPSSTAIQRRISRRAYVPFRNAHFLSAAVSWAEVLGAKKVFICAVEQDSSGYPDCRPYSTTRPSTS